MRDYAPKISGLFIKSLNIRSQWVYNSYVAIVLVGTCRKKWEGPLIPFVFLVGKGVVQHARAQVFQR